MDQHWIATFQARIDAIGVVQGHAETVIAARVGVALTSIRRMYDQLEAATSPVERQVLAEMIQIERIRAGDWIDTLELYRQEAP